MPTAEHILQRHRPGIAQLPDIPYTPYPIPHTPCPRFIQFPILAPRHPAKNAECYQGSRPLRPVGMSSNAGLAAPYVREQGQDPERPIKSLTESVGAGAIELIINGSPAFRCVCGQICRHDRRIAFVRKNDQQVRPARDAGRRRADERVEARTEKNGVQGLAARRLGDDDLGR